MYVYVYVSAHVSVHVHLYVYVYVYVRLMKEWWRVRVVPPCLLFVCREWPRNPETNLESWEHFIAKYKVPHPERKDKQSAVTFPGGAAAPSERALIFAGMAPATLYKHWQPDFNIESVTRPGLEPGLSGPGGRRLIH